MKPITKIIIAIAIVSAITITAVGAFKIYKIYTTIKTEPNKINQYVESVKPELETYIIEKYPNVEKITYKGWKKVPTGAISINFYANDNKDLYFDALVSYGDIDFSKVAYVYSPDLLNPN